MKSAPCTKQDAGTFLSARALPRFSLSRPVTVFVLFAVVLVLGWIAYEKTPLQLLPSDFDRSQFVDFNDFAILGREWRHVGPGPGITYEVDECIPIEPPLSAAEDSNETRFTVTVEGRYINFEDLVTFNCCADDIELQMTIEEGLITINEIEHLIGVPCPCICDYPITAKLGPFEPGTYIFEVYQDGSFIGSTTVTIEEGR